MKHVNVRLDDETHAMLIAQAETNLRSANAQVTWLIRQEDSRRTRRERSVPTSAGTNRSTP